MNKQLKTIWMTLLKIEYENIIINLKMYPLTSKSRN